MDTDQVLYRGKWYKVQEEDDIFIIIRTLNKGLDIEENKTLFRQDIKGFKYKTEQDIIPYNKVHIYHKIKDFQYLPLRQSAELIHQESRKNFNIIEQVCQRFGVKTPEELQGLITRLKSNK